MKEEVSGGRKRVRQGSARASGQVMRVGNNTGVEGNNEKGDRKMNGCIGGMNDDD